MKKRIPRQIGALVYLVLWQASVQAAVKFWDVNGAVPGAGGATPSGTWDAGTTANWNTNTNGAATPTTWENEDDAIFSAGNDATGDFTVIMNTSQIVGNLTVEEGGVTISFESGFYPYLNIGNNVAGKGIISVAPGLNTGITVPLEGGDDRWQLKKIGTGTLTLSGANSLFGTNIIAEGTLAVANTAALGDTTVPTVVSNDATLLLTSASLSELVVLNGYGFANSGALRNAAGISWTGGAVLGSDASIVNANGGTWNWTAAKIHSEANSYNVTFGGDIGFTRLNIPYPSVSINNGAIYKEGNCLLGIDQPNYCSAFYFNGGFIRPRTEGLYGGFGSGNIYIGAGAGEFQTGENGGNPGTLTRPMILASGANASFNCQYKISDPSVVFGFACAGVISGPGGVNKTNLGTLYLNARNTYTGNTTIRWGYLTLGANGSISNSAAIDLQSTNSVFNVTSNANGFVLQAAQTLKGNGTVLGNVNAKGTIAPGASIGSLTNDGNLTLGGSILIEVDKSQSPVSNDLITVTGTLSHGGGASLTVVNLGPTLATNDSFQVFSKPVTGGGTINVTGGGATWTNRLALDGSIAVLSVSPKVAATNLTIQAVGPTSRTVGGSGAGNSAYNVYASTNVALPMSSWWLIGTTNSTAGGLIQFLDTQATNVQRFYRFGQ